MASCLTDYSTCTRTHGDKRLDFGVMCCMRKEMMVCCLLSVVCCLSAEEAMRILVVWEYVTLVNCKVTTAEAQLPGSGSSLL